MRTTRRSFIKTSGAAVLALGAIGPFGMVSGQGVADKGLHSLPAESLADPLSYLSRVHFEPLLNTTMRGSGTTAASSLRLVEISDKTSALNLKNGFHGESFTLIFEPVSRKRPDEGKFNFEHQSLGQFSLDIFPYGRDGRFQAVINRITE